MTRSLKLTAIAAALACSVFFAGTAGASAAAPILQSAAADGSVPSLAPMVRQILPSVVNIQVKGKKAVDVPTLQIPQEFQFMFPDLGNMGSQKQEREFRALGSGVIINAEKGLVVTNFHVVDSAEEIKVETSDGRTFSAEKVGQDEHTDLALLKLKDFSGLTQMPIADSDDLQVGDFAIAVGNPFGLGQTVTSGIISALGRSGLNIENIENFIQTDAAINSGNSGGALVNLRGELIGINTAILGPNGGNIGIGFAIPSNMVRTITDQILKYGSVKRGMLGVTGTELNADLAQSFGYTQSSGAFVNQVMKGSAADKAGVKPGDIITSVNGKSVKSFAQLRAQVATNRPGSDITLGVFRNGKTLTLNVKLGAEESFDEDAENGEVSDLAPALKGASFADSDEGIKVTSVAQGSVAARIGLKQGDIITGLNRSDIGSISELKQALSKAKGRIGAIRIKRGSSEIFITLR
ncbi:MAG: DegQ family serine endoprotease [Succinivibrio sp.]|jgi:serine protease Do/serine protease DegQ|nr:DegQ family serine endoprotease [Succinivibrio sp.]